MKKINKQNVNVHIPITMINYSFKGEISLPPNETYTLHIDYPLSITAKFDIKTGKKGMGVIDIINKIGKAYEKIYEVDDEEEQNDYDDGHTYGVCGHSIDDLSLSGITVDHNKKKITIDVDS